MKPPVRVYLSQCGISGEYELDANLERLKRHSFPCDTIHRYRLDTPKRVPPSRLNVAGGVVRKKRKAKRRGRK